MANPKPSSGVWKIGETTVPIGAADTENTLTSSQIEDGVSFFSSRNSKKSRTLTKLKLTKKR